MIKENELKDARSEAQSNEACTYPHVGGRLAEYLADPLNFSAAQEVEAHLLECLHCREFYMAMSSIFSEARRVKGMSARTDESPPNNAKVTRLADFKKDWP